MGTNVLFYSFSHKIKLELFLFFFFLVLFLSKYYCVSLSWGSLICTFSVKIQSYIKRPARFARRSLNIALDFYIR